MKPAALLFAATLLTGCVSHQTTDLTPSSAGENASVSLNPQQLATTAFGYKPERASEDQDKRADTAVPVSYDTKNRVAFANWARSQKLLVEDWGSVDRDHRRAFVTGAGAREKLRHQNYCTILKETVDFFHPGLFFIAGQPKSASALKSIMNDYRLRYDDWGVYYASEYNEKGDENPASLHQPLFMVHVKAEEQSFWMKVLGSKPEVAWADSMIDYPFISLVRCPIPESGIKRKKALRLMDEHGYYFTRSAEAGQQDSDKIVYLSEGESTQIWVPTGEEATAIKLLKKIGLKASFYGLLDGQEVSTVNLTGQIGADGKLKAALTLKEALIGIQNHLKSIAPAGMKFEDLGRSGLRATSVHSGAWALKSAREKVAWEKVEITIVLSTSAEKMSEVEIYLMLKASSTGKGSGRNTAPEDDLFIEAAKQKAATLTAEQQFTRELLKGITTNLQN